MTKLDSIPVTQRIELEFPNRHTVTIDSCDAAAALQALEAMVRGGGNHFVLFPDAWNMYNATRDEQLRDAYRRASAIFPDGICWLMLARIQGRHLPQRIPGPSFMAMSCSYGLERGWRHYFYGGASGVAEKLAAIFPERFPGLQVAGACSPPFRPLSPAEEIDIKRRIESSRADLLWVALGAPKQEFWMASHLGQINVPVMLGVGAAFDFHSGRRPWAPLWLRRLGLEWAFRTVSGGKQTFRRNVRCVSSIALLLTRAALQRCLGNKTLRGSPASQ